MKKLLAVLLAITIVMAMGVVAFAAHDGDTHGIDSEAAVGEQKELATSGGSQFGKTDFYLNIDKNAVSGDTQISATIPLWVCMYAYGGDGMVVTPADAYKILNTGTDTDIKVYAMRALPQEAFSPYQAAFPEMGRMSGRKARSRAGLEGAGRGEPSLSCSAERVRRRLSRCATPQW